MSNRGALIIILAATGCVAGSVDDNDGTDEGGIAEEAVTSATDVVVSAEADAYVRSGSYASRSYGKETTLHADDDASGTVKRAYLRFRVGTVATIARATLRLYVTDSSSDAVDVKTVSSTSWSESGLTWNNKPAVDGVLVGSIGAVSSGKWVELDVTSVVASGRVLSLALIGRSDDGADFGARERSSGRPQLVIATTTQAPTDGGSAPDGTTPPPACVPTTCALQGKNCGSISDGCGGTLACGSCGSSQTCGGGGTPNVCGAPSCLSGSGPLVTVSGAQTSYDKRDDFGASTRIDARTASFTGQLNTPVRIGDGDDLCWSGGKIFGTWDPKTTSWSAYHDTYAFTVYGNDMIIENLRVDNYGDSINIRVEPELGNNFTVRGAHVTNNHDDCFQNDGMKSGTLEDSLFDGCYAFFSTRGYGSGPNNVVTIRNNLARLQAFPTYYGGSAADPSDPSQYKAGGFWKVDEFDKAPKLEIHDNIFRADQDSHTWIKLTPDPRIIAHASNNIIVWLGQGAFPDPVPPGFTVTTDKSVWDNAVAAWKASHP